MRSMVATGVDGEIMFAGKGGGVGGPARKIEMHHELMLLRGLGKL